MKQLIISASRAVGVLLAAVIALVGLAPASSQAVTSATIASATNSCTSQVLRQGARGACVSELQRRLNAAGSSVGSVDGLFGPKTRAGVVKHQQRHRLTVDGIVGRQTWQSLSASVTPAKPAVNSAWAIDPRSPAQVRDLQNRLAKASFPVGRFGPDGGFGADTRSAVIAFQRHYGLSATGVVDAKTWSTLKAKPTAPASRIKHLHSIKNGRGVNIVADKSDRTAYVFRDGQLLRAITVRFGGEGVYKGVPYSKSTPNGVFKVYMQVRHGKSDRYNADMPYFTVFYPHIGFHQSADFANTGYGHNGKRGSHGCINVGNGIDAGVHIYEPVQAAMRAGRPANVAVQN